MSRFPADENVDSAEAEAAISEEEVIAFAMALADSVCQSDSARFLQLVDWGRIIDKATAFPDLAELQDTRSDFKEKGLAAIARTGGMHTEIHNAIKDGSIYKPLRVDLDDIPSSILFRLGNADGGLNYHRYSLVRNLRGAVVADDLFVFLTAEELSHSFRRAWLPLAKVALQEAAGEFDSLEDPVLVHIDDISEISTLVEEQKYTEALDLYRRLPESLRTNKYFLANSLTAAEAVSEEDYIRIIDDFRRAYPQDAALDLILIGGYATRKKFGQALRCVERLNALVGGDAMLSAKRATLLLELGRVAEARAAIDTAIAAEPEEYNGYAIGLDVALAERNFDEAAKYLTILETQFGAKWDDLEAEDGFAEFVKSPKYRI